MSTYTIEQYGFPFALELHGSYYTSDDASKALRMAHNRLKAMSVKTVAAMWGESIKDQCLDDGPNKADDVAVDIACGVTRKWHDSNGFDCSFRAIMPHNGRKL